MTLSSLITIQSAAPTIRQYPFIGHGENGAIVLFYTEGCGVAISNTDAYDIGYHSTDWAMSCFKPFAGTVTLGESEVMRQQMRDDSMSSDPPNDAISIGMPDISPSFAAQPAPTTHVDAAIASAVALFNLLGVNVVVLKGGAQ